MLSAALHRWVRRLMNRSRRKRSADQRRRSRLRKPTAPPSASPSGRPSRVHWICAVRLPRQDKLSRRAVRQTSSHVTQALGWCLPVRAIDQGALGAIRSPCSWRSGSLERSPFGRTLCDRGEKEQGIVAIMNQPGGVEVEAGAGGTARVTQVGDTDKTDLGEPERSESKPSPPQRSGVNGWALSNRSVGVYPAH